MGQSNFKLITMTPVLVTFLMALSANDALARSVNCNGPGGNLQSAINNASIEEVILVSGDCDRGPYIISKDISLRGPAILSAPDGGSQVLRIELASVGLTNLEINAEGDADQDGIVLESAAVKATDIVVTMAAQTGVLVGNNSYAFVQGGEFVGNNVAFLVGESSSLLMGDTSIRDSGPVGVFVTAASSAIIVGTDILDGSGDGLLVDRLSNISLFRSTVEGNDVGIKIADKYATLSLRTEINTIENNRVDIRCEARGILEAEAPQMSATQNTEIDPNCIQLGTLF